MNMFELFRHKFIKNKSIYEQVAIEMQNNHYDSGLQMLSFSIADGDENKAKAKYISLRYDTILAGRKLLRE
ncbi:MAG: hypothetical protein R8M14_06040 [Ghiorsea sp.]